MAEWAGGQLGGKAAAKSTARSIAGVAAVGVAAGSATAIKEEIIKWDEEALDALFNKIIRYLIINNYISTISELYIWQLKGKALLPLWGAKLLVILKSICYNED